MLLKGEGAAVVVEVFRLGMQDFGEDAGSVELRVVVLVAGPVGEDILVGRVTVQVKEVEKLASEFVPERTAHLL